MTELEIKLSKQAILSSPTIMADNHAFAAMVARLTGKGGPVLVHTQEEHLKPTSIHGLKEVSA